MSLRIAIVGGGWAGLAAAIELTPQHQVTLFESAKQLGGRARKAQLDQHTLDNGQHLLLGAYSEYLNLLRTIGVDEASIIKRLPLQLNLLHHTGTIELNTPLLPAPLHLLWGLLTLKGISLSERFSALPGIARLLKTKLSTDCSVEDLLDDCKQPDSLRVALWRPLCVAALNTPSTSASAQVFINTLSEAFDRSRRASNLLIPAANLEDCFPKPASAYIKSHHGVIKTACKVYALRPDNQQIIISSDDGDESFDHVILATPAWITADLLAPIQECNAAVAMIKKLHHAPICTVYLEYPKNTNTTKDMMGMLHSTGEWLFNRRLTGNDNIISVVISADGPHMAWDNTALANRIEKELQGLFPDWPAAKKTWVIREKRATFDCCVGIQQLRPTTDSGHANISLAGDYVLNDFPATLEGAVRSGLYAARQLINSDK